MFNLWWLVFVIAAVVFVLRRFGANGMGKELDRAHRTGELAGLVAVIAASPVHQQPTLWDQAIGSLWNEYARETATRLVMEAAARSDAAIVQFWINKVMEVEPEIAFTFFTEDFLASYFRPEIAAQCGRRGCCG
jgi:hypothetical protein